MTLMELKKNNIYINIYSAKRNENTYIKLNNTYCKNTYLF